MIHEIALVRRLATIGTVLLLSGIAMPGEAADIKSVGLPGNQRIRISGPLVPDDRDKLHEFLNYGPDFPSGILIDSDSGDVATGIAIGILIRDAMLPVTAVGECGVDCILVWMSGIRRDVRTTMDPRELATHSEQVEEYLRRMELDDDTITRLLASGPLSPQQALDLLGTRSRSHETRLVESCGTLNEEQQEHWRAIQALAAVDSALNAMAQGMGGGQAMYVVAAETEQRAAAARELPADYRAKIEKRQTEISSCRTDAVMRWRASGSP